MKQGTEPTGQRNGRGGGRAKRRSRHLVLLTAAFVLALALGLAAQAGAVKDDTDFVSRATGQAGAAPDES